MSRRNVQRFATALSEAERLQDALNADLRKLVTTFRPLFQTGLNVGYEISQLETPPRKAMKGFAASLTASRLEEMLAFYMTPAAGSPDEADDREESGTVSTKTADHTAERTASLAALTEN